MTDFNIGDGFSAEQIFRNPNLVQAYTYDDVIIMPGTLGLLLASAQAITPLRLHPF